VVVWEEDIGGGRHAIFVSRLVGGDHFELFKPASPSRTGPTMRAGPTSRSPATSPTSRGRGGRGALLTFVGHFEGGEAAPRFKHDTPGGIAASAFADVENPQRAPISSTCTANPTNADVPPAGRRDRHALLPLHGRRARLEELFAEAFAPTDVRTLAASDPTSSSATLHGSANPGGTSARVHFDFGATAAFGSSTTPATLGVSGRPDRVRRRASASPTVRRSTTAPSPPPTSRASSVGRDGHHHQLPPVVSVGHLDEVGAPP